MTIERHQSQTKSVSLLDVVDRILDKGIVIDAWVAVSVINIELITIEARIIVSSIETYAKYAQLLGELGPIAGGFAARERGKSLGEGLSDVTSGLQQGAANIEESLPLVGGQGQSQMQKEKKSKPKSRRKTKSRTRKKR